MLKAITEFFIKLYYKRNPEMITWMIPIDENIDIHIIIERSYLDRHEFGTRVEYYKT